MYTKKFVGIHTSNKNGAKYVSLLVFSEAAQDRGTRVTSFNPKDIAKCTDGEGNYLPQEVIDALAEEQIENFDKVTVDLDGVYNRMNEGSIVIDEKTGRPAEYTKMTVAVMYSFKYDYLFVDGKPFINPVTGSFDKYPIIDSATGRPKRFYDQGWSPEERVASMIEAGFYVKANTPSTQTVVNQPNQQLTPEQIAAIAAQQAALQQQQLQQQTPPPPGSGVA